MPNRAPVPPTKATVYRTCGSIAFAVAASALVISSVVRLEFGSVIAVLLVPLLLAVAVFLVVLIARLALIGFLPADVDHLVPAVLLRRVPVYVMFRFGILTGALLLIAACLAALLTGVDLNPLVHAFVYVVFLDVFVNATFAAVLNFGIIVMRLQRRVP